MKITQCLLLAMLMVLWGCGGKFTDNSAPTTSASVVLNPGESEPGARLVFSNNNFVNLYSFADAVNTATSLSTSHQCLGDVLKVFYADGDDYSGTPTAFPTPSITDGLFSSNRPVFIRNVSVDITNTYYPTTQSGILASDVCSYRANSSSPAPSTCADFDRIPAATPAPTIAPTPTPNPSPMPSVTPGPHDLGSNEYFGTSFYRVRDAWCTSQGPTVSPDPEVTKAGVGGVSIDLDRSQLGNNEDLLMVITYHALNENSGVSNWPAVNALDKDTGLALAPAKITAHGSNDRTILKVNLIGTQQSLETLLQVPQPRVWTYANTTNYPIYIKEIATLEDPFGSLRTEQVYIPLSQNALIDRIRIERARGSYHLFQIDLYRLGNRSE